MDFDYSTILYIVLGIIYFIFSGVSKNKKKAQGRARKNAQPGTETVDPPPVNRRPTFEELLEEFTGQKALEPEPVVQEVAAAPVKVVEPVSKRPERTHTKETKKEFTPMVSFAAYDEVQEEERVDYTEMFSSLDSAKQAFIASEIFQRKY